MDIGRYHLLDTISSISGDGRSIICVALVPQAAPVFDGHFPAYPVFPGTMQIELMAQAVGMMIFWGMKCERLPVLAGVDKARFRQSVRPGAQLTVFASAKYQTDRLWIADTHIIDNSLKVSEAEIRLGIVDFPNPKTKAYAEGALERLVGNAKHTEA